MHVLRTVAALCALGLAALVSACASHGGSGDDASSAAAHGSVEVFGTIDAGVSSVKSKSGR
ncbi:MAG: hypothetical protein QM586_17190 [Xenophilus sp.]